MKNIKKFENFWKKDTDDWEEGLRDILAMQNDEVDNLKKDIQGVRDYVIEHNDNGSEEYQQTITKLNRIEQYFINKR